MNKKGRLEKDVTAYGNKYWIQILDSEHEDNSDLESMVNKNIEVCIDENVELLKTRLAVSERDLYLVRESHKRQCDLNDRLSEKKKKLEEELKLLQQQVAKPVGEK